MAFFQLALIYCNGKILYLIDGFNTRCLCNYPLKEYLY